MTELLCQMIGIDPLFFSPTENAILEAELFNRICEGLIEHYRAQYRNYFSLMKFTWKMETAMLDANFIRYAINDILMSGEYSIRGIARYAETPEEVVCDILAGLNVAPTLSFARRIINLHRLVRPELYQNIIEKMLLAYVAL